jgi:hypothetical protein
MRAARQWLNAAVVLVVCLGQSSRTAAGDDPALAARKQACGAGDATACERLGDEYKLRDATVAAEFYRKALGLYQRACDRGDLAGCMRLGDMYDRGAGVARDAVRARVLLARACDAGSAAGCVPLGDTPCDARSLEGCLRLALSYESDRDLPAAVAAHERACQRGAWISCAKLARLYQGGPDVPSELAALVPRDPARAAALYWKACEGEGLDCAVLGKLYEDGAGVPKDLTRAVKSYGKACEGGDRAACDSLARVCRGTKLEGCPAAVEGKEPPAKTAALEEPEPPLGKVVVRGKAGGGPLTMRLHAVDLADFFHALHVLTRRGFVINADVRGSIDVDVEGATPEEVLAALKNVGITVAAGQIGRVSRAQEPTVAARPPRRFAGAAHGFQFTRGELLYILMLFEEISELKVWTTPVVDEKVSVFVADTRWDQVLDGIAASAGREVAIDGNRLFVLPKGMAKADAVSVRDAKTTDHRRLTGLELLGGLEWLDVAELRLVGLARLGNGWKAFVYGPGRRFFRLEPGDQVFDGRVRSVGPTGVTFETDGGGTRELTLER